EMVIVRIIREQLSPQHAYFIVEMGAYGIGSIARLCDLTPPKLSVITAIGQAHYERFKTLDDTTRAKFEIAEAVLAQQGHIILHDSVLEQPFAKSFYDVHKDNVITVGTTGQAKIISSTQTEDGLLIILQWKNIEYTIATPLYGLHHAGNIALAFATAAHLGMDPAHIVIALKSAPQISHRLEVKRFPDHILIDDAYNSNPKGFSSALDLLHLLGQHTRRILVTPGIVELGADHDSAHHSLGLKAAETADIVIAVCPERIRSFSEG
ncbi:MAG: Mur ligase family protein, partial [Pseudomonadota bacterium]